MAAACDTCVARRSAEHRVAGDEPALARSGGCAAARGVGRGFCGSRIGRTWSIVLSRKKSSWQSCRVIIGWRRRSGLLRRTLPMKSSSDFPMCRMCCAGWSATTSGGTECVEPSYHIDNVAAAISLVASVRGVALLPAYVEKLLPWSVVSRGLAGETRRSIWCWDIGGTIGRRCCGRCWIG